MVFRRRQSGLVGLRLASACLTLTLGRIRGYPNAGLERPARISSRLSGISFALTPLRPCGRPAEGQDAALERPAGRERAYPALRRPYIDPRAGFLDAKMRRYENRQGFERNFQFLRFVTGLVPYPIFLPQLGAGLVPDDRQRRRSAWKNPGIPYLPAP